MPWLALCITAVSELSYTDRIEDKPLEMPPLDEQACEDNIVHDTHARRIHLEFGNSKIPQII